MKPTSAFVISLRRRLAAAYADLAKVRWAKSGTVNAGSKAGSYSFIPITSILSEVRRVRAKYGILVIFSSVRYDPAQCEKRYTYTTRSSYDGHETSWIAANGHYDVELINADDPEDTMSLTVSCEAKDNSDKLDNKLLTNAMRSLYRQLFDIDEGSESDPESVNIPTDPLERPRTASSDAFFGSARKPAPTLTPSQAVGADRSIEERRELIAKWSKLASMDAIWADLRDENGPDPGAWTDQQVREAYARMVAVGRAAKEGQ